MAFLAGAPTARIEKVIRTGRFCCFKWTVSRDELEYSLQVLVNLGRNKGRGRFLNYSDAPHPQKDSFFIYILAIIATSTLLYYVIGVYFVNVIFHLIVQDTRPGPCFPLLSNFFKLIS